MTQQARLTIGVISAGRCGAVLGAALARAGHRVIGAVAVSERSVRRAEELLPGVPLADPTVVAEQADLVLLSVPDDSLAGLVNGLVATHSLRSGQIVLHTSGVHGVDVLRPAAAVGALTLAMHPAMTFTGRIEDVQRVASCCMAVTAEAEHDTAWHVGEALVLEMGAEPVRVGEQARAVYHAALTHGANHLVTLVNDCVDLLEANNIRPAERLLAPLLSAALDNALRHKDKALTGPVMRADAHTVQQHLDVLHDTAPDVLASYRALARRTAHRAEAAGLLSSDTGAKVRFVLDEEL